MTKYHYIINQKNNKDINPTATPQEIKQKKEHTNHKKRRKKKANQKNRSDSAYTNNMCRIQRIIQEYNRQSKQPQQNKTKLAPPYD
ncbi:hypothetical protein Q6245_28120, partial [Klebsiella pneumoniae]|uniref:hypothetical protein n=1 Tax=Klebsiella pneumoniae TaxID=573 RepID=UPI002731A799